MQIHFLIETDKGEKFDITSNYADIIALEEKFEMDASDLITHQRATWLGYLAWHALNRSGQVAEDYDTWKNSIAELETVEIPPKKK